MSILHPKVVPLLVGGFAMVILLMLANGKRGFDALAELERGTSGLLSEERQPVSGKTQQSIPEALREAFGHRGYILLCSGYWVCGFQLMFISIHFPAFLTDRGMTPETGMTALALIGLFNILGSFV